MQTFFYNLVDVFKELDIDMVNNFQNVSYPYFKWNSDKENYILELNVPGYEKSDFKLKFLIFSMPYRF